MSPEGSGKILSTSHMRDQSVTAFELNDWVRKHLKGIGSGAALGILAGIGLGFTMTPAYRVNVVLTPAIELERGSGAANSLVGGLGGLAALAGVSLGNTGDRVEAAEVLRSRQLAREFIKAHDLVSVLLPPSRGLSFFRSHSPSLEEAVRFFLAHVIAIDEDRRSGVINISMTWSDREQVAGWANAYVALVNQTLRERAIAESERRSEYLAKQLESTQVVDLRDAANSLIENNLKESMIAHTREDYAYHVADPAVAPDPTDVVRPKRLLLAIAGGVVGLIVAALAAFVTSQIRVRRAQAV